MRKLTEEKHTHTNFLPSSCLEDGVLRYVRDDVQRKLLFFKGILNEITTVEKGCDVESGLFQSLVAAG